MAPSRGLTSLLRLNPRPISNNNGFRRAYSDLSRIAADPARKVQVYVSRSLDPYVNLSIEHYLLQKSSPESTVLFLYTNRPCIVIGRNQNPWVEVNLGLLKNRLGKAESVDLVRRRSGGGTVFHDEGNVNYSVICPTAAFDRDKHAHMVVRALQSLGVKQAKVNERHDIVLDICSDKAEGEYITEITLPLLAPKPLKISGSAYKLTRLRSLHHGTCLLSSPNIGTIGQYLRSLAKPYILARGVDSVSSPITNVNVANEEFEDAVVEEFGKLYGSVEPVTITGDEINVPEISKGLAEIKSLDWTYLQTPQFTFSSRKTDDDSRERPPLPDFVPSDAFVRFTARNGTITEADITDGHSKDLYNSESISSTLVGKKLHEIEDWQAVLLQPHSLQHQGIAQWLNMLFR